MQGSKLRNTAQYRSFWNNDVYIDEMSSEIMIQEFSFICELVKEWQHLQSRGSPLAERKKKVVQALVIIDDTCSREHVWLVKKNKESYACNDYTTFERTEKSLAMLYRDSSP